MAHSNTIAAFLLAHFFVLIVRKNELPRYFGFLWG